MEINKILIVHIRKKPSSSSRPTLLLWHGTIGLITHTRAEHMSLYNDAVCVVVLGAAALKFYLAIEKGN
jgi:hypothetical protein